MQFCVCMYLIYFFVVFCRFFVLFLFLLFFRGGVFLFLLAFLLFCFVLMGGSFPELYCACEGACMRACLCACMRVYMCVYLFFFFCFLSLLGSCMGNFDFVRFYNFFRVGWGFSLFLFSRELASFYYCLICFCERLFVYTFDSFQRIFFKNIIELQDNYLYE